MTLPNRQLFWIANSTKRRAPVPLIRASAVRSAVGRPAKKTDGFVTADTHGTRSIPEASALPASISGLRLSAFLVAAGRRIRTGMGSNSQQMANLKVASELLDFVSNLRLRTVCSCRLER
jgi:hypothetical protein